VPGLLLPGVAHHGFHHPVEIEAPRLLPSLRDRREDIPLLVWSIVNRRRRALGRRVSDVPKRAMQPLTAYDWPGNVRELENVVERAFVLSRGATLQLEDPGAGNAAEVLGLHPNTLCFGMKKLGISRPRLTPPPGHVTGA
jgi:formate hydrogenlyase transcriptional activator